MKKTIIQAFILLALFVLCYVFLPLTGCYASLKHTDTKGNVTEYVRIGNQSIGVGSIELPCGGKLTFEGQESKLPHVSISAKEIVIGGEEVVR